MGSLNLMDLPDDILRSICHFCTDVSILNLGLTCNTLRTLTLDESIWTLRSERYPWIEPERTTYLHTLELEDRSWGRGKWGERKNFGTFCEEDDDDRRVLNVVVHGNVLAASAESGLLVYYSLDDIEALPLVKRFTIEESVEDIDIDVRGSDICTVAACRNGTVEFFRNDAPSTVHVFAPSQTAALLGSDCWYSGGMDGNLHRCVYEVNSVSSVNTNSYILSLEHLNERTVVLAQKTQLSLYDIRTSGVTSTCSAAAVSKGWRIAVDGNDIIISTLQGEVVILDHRMLDTPRDTIAIRDSNDEPLQARGLSVFHDTIVVGAEDGELQSFDRNSLQKLWQTTGLHSSIISGIARNGLSLYTCSWDGTVQNLNP